MSEEVKIRITNEADTRALTDEEKKIQDLTRAAKAYEAKGMTPAANSARSEAAELQKALITKRQLEETTMRAAGKTALADAAASEVAEMQMSLDLQKKLGVTYEEGLSLARSQIASEAAIAEETAARLALEKQVTRQKAEQAALDKESLLSGKVRNELVSAARLAVSGGNAGRSLSSAVGNIIQALGPEAVAVAAVVAVTAAAVAMRDSENEKDQAQKNKIAEETAKDIRRGDILDTYRGSSGEALGDEQKDRQEIFEREQHRAELERAAKFKWYSMSTWSFGGMRKTAGQRAIEENEQELKRLRDDAANKDKERQKLFNSEEGGLKLQIARDVAQHSAAGMRAKRQDQHTLDWLSQYRSAMSESGDVDKAMEMADLTTQENERQQMIHNASGLVNARSGAGDIAQAARLANSMQDHRMLEKIHDAMRELVAHDRAAADAVTRENFSRGITAGNVMRDAGGFAG